MASNEVLLFVIHTPAIGYPWSETLLDIWMGK